MHDGEHTEWKQVNECTGADEDQELTEWEGVSRRFHHIVGVNNSMEDDEETEEASIMKCRVSTKEPPREVVKLMIRLFPDASTVHSLQAACEGGASLPCLLLLLRACLAAQEHPNRTQSFINPLQWVAFEVTPVRAVQWLLDAYPEGAIRRSVGGWDSVYLCPLDNLLSFISNHHVYTSVKESWWKKLDLLLMASTKCHQNRGEHNDFLVQDARETSTRQQHVHALVRHMVTSENRGVIKGSRLALTKMRNAIPNHFREAEEKTGRLALHILLEAKRSPVAFQDHCETFGILTILLEAYAEAAGIPTPDGRLPLHLAVEQGWESHDLLLEAAPLALATRDYKTRLYPFQLAATFQSTLQLKSVAALNRTFLLLRFNPVLA
eukprot:CAMPEP_0198291960 /NCGR_PEP_ID=MMETSP1449-20131203/9287_1 /TAXON_ID=420275 /ORGANISM="Attheya septentrionalis, Strain CCMP2084" /LENGTH=379 /DNA_ID=CAMNT_0043990647 /DNA_START=49 /DNA_END=1184 /DNA_ORIENTATION=-